MSDPVGYFLTWATYGTWLPGDARGWVKYGHGFQLPDPILELESAVLLTEDACVLAPQKRQLVEKTTEDHCKIWGWTLHAVNCRTNHLHVVVTANGRKPEVVREQFKAWCTRRLRELQSRQSAPSDSPLRENWWADRGSDRYLNDEECLEQAIL
jgi:REP element-mobilizing transposase RayT